MDTGLAVDGGRCGGVLELEAAVDANHVARDGPSDDPEGQLLEYLAMLNDPPQVDRGIVAWWGWAG